MGSIDINLTITSIAALGSVLAAFFTGCLALNDHRRMRRKPPTVELTMLDPAEQYPGWHRQKMTIRNHVPVGIYVAAIRTKRRRAFINTLRDASTAEPDAYGNANLLTELARSRRSVLDTSVAASGTLQLTVYTTDIRTGGDLGLEWQWADGQKR